MKEPDPKTIDEEESCESMQGVEESKENDLDKSQEISQQEDESLESKESEIYCKGKSSEIPQQRDESLESTAFVSTGNTSKKTLTSVLDHNTINEEESCKSMQGVEESKENDLDKSQEISQQEDESLESKESEIYCKGKSSEIPKQRDEPLENEFFKKVQKKPSSTKSKKPYRPCPFCFCLQSALSKHLVKKHGDETEIKEALKLPEQDRNRAFLLLKRKGIMISNMKALQSGDKDKLDLIRERKSTLSKHKRQSSDSAEERLIYCSKCLGFFVKTYFHRHRKNCHLNERSVYLPTAILPEPVGEAVATDKRKDENFKVEILGPLHSDDIGNLCKKDMYILGFGKKKFHKLLFKKGTEKYEDKKTNIRTEMRRIGKLFLEFQQVCDTNNVTCQSSLDLFKAENFNYLQESIENVTTSEDGNVKFGLKKEIGYLLKRICKFLHGKFCVEGFEEKVCQIERFQSVLSFQWTDVFGDAEASLLLQRQTKLRKPSNLPRQTDVKKLRDFTLTEIQKMTKDDYHFYVASDFIKLRNLVVSRLTLFNARRGGEPCCLQINQWIEAENDAWLGENHLTEDLVEKDLLRRFKIAYQTGKGGKLVPLLILDDCWIALKQLCDPEKRMQAGVHPENQYVFPHTQNSMKHVTGWVAVTECCSLAGLNNAINATKMRHYISTIYAGLEVKESERETFYSHMGHSQSINKHVYQSPLARQTISKVGHFLKSVDEGNTSRATLSREPTSKIINEEKTCESMQGVEQSKENDLDKSQEISQQEDESLESKESEIYCIGKSSEIHVPQQRDESLENSNQNQIISTTMCSPMTLLKSKSNSKRRLLYPEHGKSNVISLRTLIRVPDQEEDYSESFEGLEQTKMINIENGPEVSLKSNTSRATLSREPTSKIINEEESCESMQGVEQSKENDLDKSQEISQQEDESLESKESEIYCKRKSSEIPQQRDESLESSDRPYRLWEKNDTDTVKRFFVKYIMSVEYIESNKGSLPGIKELKQFIREYPQVLKDLTKEEKIKRLRSKIFNERKLVREKLRRTQKQGFTKTNVQKW